jgi:DNA polymerase III delta prime subunit
MGDITWTKRVLDYLHDVPAKQPDDNSADEFCEDATNALVRIAKQGKSRHDYIDLIIGAALLDAADVDDSVLTGTHVLATPRDQQEIDSCVHRVFQSLYHGRTCTYGTRRDGPDIGIVLDGDDDLRYLSTWQCCQTIIGIGPLASLPSDMLRDADRKWVLAGVDRADIFNHIFKTVTGFDPNLSDGDIYGFDAATVKSILRRGISIDAAMQRLMHRVDAARRKRSAEKAKEKSDIDEMLDAYTPPDPTPIGDAAAGVVKKLSEMTGFGTAREWGLQLAQDIRDHRDGLITWSDLDRGVLLSGPPGCGKTTFARALAAECEIDLVVSTYTDWHGSGNGDNVAKELRKLFSDWRKKGQAAPFILFLDEFDSMGARGANGHNESWFITQINAWLAFLDGAEPRVGVIAIAATNHPDRVDPALRRPGRLDRHVEIPMPSVADLPGIVRHHLGIDDVHAARACRGMTPADIQQACRDARRLARRARRPVTANDLVTSVRKLAKSHNFPDDWRSAIHESGHAIMAHLRGVEIDYLDVDRGHVSTVPKNFTIGNDFHSYLLITLSGRAAEDVVLGSPSTLCVADLARATESARLMHTQGGLGASGLVHVTDDDWRARNLLQDPIKKTLDDTYAVAIKLIRENKQLLIKLAKAAQRERFLTGDDIVELLAPSAKDTQPISESSCVPSAIQGGL